MPAVAALAVVVTGSVAATATAPVAAAAYAPRVVIVVGPSHGSTARYIERANRYADQARAYGASVAEIYTPHATWSRVLRASQGANVFIYLGHGNGWPSPYAPYQGNTKDGLGLNPHDGSGYGSPVKYYGENAIARHLRLAANAVVLLNHLCYASGNGEPGFPEPSWTTARKRVDNYAAGFLRARAMAVIADGHTSLGNELHYLFGGPQSILRAWRADPDHNGHERTFSSVRTPGFGVHIDPDTTNTGFYRSIVLKSGALTTGIRTPAMKSVNTTRITLRSAPSSASDAVARSGDGAPLWIIGGLVSDGKGRTWAPVITTNGRRAWAPAWLARYSGTAHTKTSVVLRAAARASGARLKTVAQGTRVTILKSTRDGANRLWLNVRIPGGKTGWMAGWLMKP